MLILVNDEDLKVEVTENFWWGANTVMARVMLPMLDIYITNYKANGYSTIPGSYIPGKLNMTDEEIKEATEEYLKDLNSVRDFLEAYVKDESFPLEYKNAKRGSEVFSKVFPTLWD